MAQPKILLVDDDHDFLKIATEFLELRGYSVVSTSDLETAKRMLEEGSFAIAFLDICFDMKDNRDERGLALAIDTIGTSSVPKVILTVLKDAEYVRASLMPRGKTGAAIDFLHKEGGLQQMADAVERVVRRARVFLSYASPDRETVLKLYQQLQVSGFLPWMDKMDLEPGEIWEEAVRKAIRQTDFAIVCLSKESVDRSGPYQNEILLILKILREQPQGKIFLIPARLQECEIVHEELRAIHRVDLFSPDGYKKLVQALQEGLNRKNKK